MEIIVPKNSQAPVTGSSGEQIVFNMNQATK